MTLVAFGVGINFLPYIERLDSFLEVSFFSDNNSKLIGKHLTGDDRLCISPDEIVKLQDPYVIVMAERESSKISIEKQLDDMGVSHERVENVLKKHPYQINCVHWPQTIQNNKIHKFIELLVHGTTECNFHCDYCYVWRKEDFHQGLVASEYSANQIRRALSKDRMGGVCHINLCALGETLFAKGIEDIIFELAAEGHYLSIITNGTLTNKISRILEFPDEIKERIFFKFSFHYEELLRTGLLEVFWENVKSVRMSSCSYSIEITPSDHLLDKIEEIKAEFNKNEDGALPHITFTRDANKEGLDLYSNLSLKEYEEFWKQFDSKMFDLKCRLYKRHISENCYAGCWSYRVNLVNGNLQGCYKQEIVDSIFENVEKPLPLLTVKNKCAMDYCFNNHAFIVWGDVPEIECETYLEMRNRETYDSRSWIKPIYKDIMSQKLYDNNFEYIDKWPDYEKLHNINRKPAFILFNSPEYGNLGDQAIAFAEKVFFERMFPKREFIEISAKQYISENLSIKNYILEEDILLLTGGGYLGSEWPWLEDISLNIIENYPNNKIIILPQTVFFEKSDFGEIEKRFFMDTINKHSNIAVCARDEKTLVFLQEYLPNKQIIESSDMVVGLDLTQYKATKKKNKVIVCMREDKEKRDISTDGMLSAIKKYDEECSIEQISTVLKKDVFLCDRREELEKIWNAFSDARLVVTDRLHASIFACLLDIPCICFDNKTGKVSDFVFSQKDNCNIVLCDNYSEFNQVLNVCINESKHNKIRTNLDNLGLYLRRECFAE